MNGIDISSWQAPGSVNLSEYDFVIIKASEGVSITDKYHKAHYENAKAKNLLTGIYHYAHPEYNTARAEAAHFVDVIKPYIGSSILALDYEGTALSYGAIWAKNWLDEVFALTGVRPLIYLQGSAVPNYSQVWQAGYKLWLAAWGASNPQTSPWGSYTIWQYRGDPLDLDRFNGSKEDWMKMASSTAKPIAPKEPEDPVKPVIEKFWPPRTLCKGMLGKDVTLLQSILDCRGYNVVTDGIFGKSLEAKVVQFQKEAFPGKPIEWDGIVGPKTWRMLVEGI